MGHKLAYCAINCIYFDEIYTGPKRGFTNPYTYLRAYTYICILPRSYGFNSGMYSVLCIMNRNVENALIRN